MRFETLALQRNEVAPGAVFRISDPQVTNALSKPGTILGIWMNYEVDEDCEDCNQNIKRKIIGGTSGSEIANLEVQVLNALEFSGANSMKLKIKSLQADPNGLSEIEMPSFSITEDGQAINGIQLFVPEGKELFYQYQVIMIMNDGTIHRSDWQDSNSNLLAIGESQINSLFKEKGDLLNETLERVLDSLGVDSEKDLIERGFEIIGGVLKKKDDAEQEDDEND